MRRSRSRSMWVMAGAAALFLAACGSDGPNAVEEPATTAVSTETPAPDDAEPTASSAPTPTPGPPSTPPPAEAFDTMEPFMQEAADRICAQFTTVVEAGTGGEAVVFDTAPLFLQTGEAGSTLEAFGEQLATALGGNAGLMTITPEVAEVAEEIVRACEDLGWSADLLTDNG